MTGALPDGTGFRPSDRAADGVAPVPASIPSAMLTHHMRRVLAFADAKRPKAGSGTAAIGLVKRGLAEYIPTPQPHRKWFVFTGDGLVMRAMLRRTRARCGCGKLAKYEGPPIYRVGAQPEAFCTVCVPIGCSCCGPKRPCVEYWYHSAGFLRMPQPEYDAFVRATKRRTAQAIEARSDATGTGAAVGESAVPQGCAR